MQSATTGLVSGDFNMITNLQARICNTNNVTPTQAIPATLTFASGSNFRTNITSTSSAYGFGSSTQSTEKWVKFEAGAHLYYLGGFSPNGSGNLFSAIDMLPGSIWHHRANNPLTGAGNFFNRKNYGHVIVENNANLVALGPVYRIQDLTITSGSSFTTSNSGQTVILGNIQAEGNLLADAASTNEVLMAGNVPQTIAGAGTVSIASIAIADNADVSLNKNISVDKSVTILGKIDFKNNRITGNATFEAHGPSAQVTATANLTAGSNIITANLGIPANSRGLGITGTGIAPNTSILLFSANGDSVYLSNPATSTISATGLEVVGSGATLQNDNTNGYDPATGTIGSTGTQTFADGINYVIDAPTDRPFGVSTAAAPDAITADFIEVNAAITVNRAFSVGDHLAVNGKITLRPLDVVRIMPGAAITGTVGSSNYIATVSNASTGEQSFVQYDVVTSSTILPIGTANNYLPVMINPTATSGFKVSVFEGITSNGIVNGTVLTPIQKQRVVDAVWNIERLTGTGSADLQLGWTPALEGSTFITLPDADLGIIINNGTSWDPPSGSADNTTNTATATVGNFGSFGVGAVAPSVPFTFNAVPDKTYGESDFDGGAGSLNTTHPIIYTSSDPLVATIVNGFIHITGAGTTTITATQASDGFYPAANISQPFNVIKAPLTIKADDKLKFANQANPVLTITYTGFVLGETAAVFTTQPAISTTAVTNSPAGQYPITVGGAVATNYEITYEDGIMTVQAQTAQTITFDALPTKIYGNADFATGANSTNNTIPITYTSSNPAVATINTSGVIHITGGGTTTITASQAGNAGYFPAPDIARTLTVNKAPLTIRVLDTVKVQGQPNPVFTFTYTGFVLGETAANLATGPTVATIATTTSPAGYYALTPEGVVTNNYNITYTAGRMTIYPPGGTELNHIHAFVSNSSTLTVRIYSTFPDLGDISLFDMHGRPLLKRNAFMPQGFASVDINISTIPAGMYVVVARGTAVELKKTILIIK
jgi:hypothetical protein